MKPILDAWHAKGLDEQRLAEKSKPFRRFLRKFAPAWDDEMAGCADGAGVPLDDYVAFQAGKYRDLFALDECTSFFAVGDATADGATLFHKTRDNQARGQCAYRKVLRHPSRPAAFHATGDTSDLGVMMMVNEHGVAGSADTGGLKVKRPKGDGVMNTYILRLIAERAERVEDVLEILQQMIRDGWYAGGSTTGTNWSFADRHGRGLRLRQNNTEEQHEFVENDVAFSIRGDTPGADLVNRRKGKITLADLNVAATDPSLCFSSSVSAMTVRIDPEWPETLSSVWFALPAWTPYLPYYPLAEGTPEAIVGGRCFELGFAMLEGRSPEYGRGVRFDAAVAEKLGGLQRRLYEDAARRDFDVRKALRLGQFADAKAAATQGAVAAARLWLDEVGELRKQV